MARLDTWIDLGRVPTPAAWPPGRVPVDGDLWYNGQTKQLNVYADHKWFEIESSPGITGSMQNSEMGLVFVSDGLPSVRDLFDGDLWYDYVADKLSIYYDDNWLVLDIV